MVSVRPQTPLALSWGPAGHWAEFKGSAPLQCVLEGLRELAGASGWGTAAAATHRGGWGHPHLATLMCHFLQGFPQDVPTQTL